MHDLYKFGQKYNYYNEDKIYLANVFPISFPKNSCSVFFIDHFYVDKDL